MVSDTAPLQATQTSDRESQFAQRVSYLYPTYSAESIATDSSSLH
jgi:hypothetical protein